MSHEMTCNEAVRIVREASLQEQLDHIEFLYGYDGLLAWFREYPKHRLRPLIELAVQSAIDGSSALEYAVQNEAVCQTRKDWGH